MAQNAATSVLVLGARTDDAAAAVDDTSAEEVRMITRILGAGIIDPTTGWQVIESSPQAMSVRVGTGTAEDNLAMVAGIASGQEQYLVRHDATYSTITVGASDPTNPRIDEIYLVVHDIPYDSGTTTRADVEIRAGTPAGTPTAPGPAAAWKAYLLLARIAVGAGVSVIANANITDMRALATFTQDYFPIVTTSVRGLMAAADKTKLDGIATGADVTGANNAATATKLATARILALYGDVSGSSTVFDGSGNFSMDVTVADDSHTHDTRYFTEAEIAAAYAALAGAIFTGVVRLPQGSATAVALGWSGESGGDSGLHFPGQSITEIVSQGAGATPGGLVIRNDAEGNRVHPKTDNLVALGSASFRFVDVWAVDGSINTSDPTLKTNLKAATKALPTARMVDELEAVAWKWKGRKRTHLGLDAAEVGGWLEDNKTDFGGYINPPDGPKGLRSHELVGVLWDTVHQILEVLTDDQRKQLGLGEK